MSTLLVDDAAAVCQSVGFEALLWPVPLQRFLSDVWGKTYLRIKGTPEKVRGVASWPEVSRVLETVRLEPPRLRLYQDCKPVDTSRYLKTNARGVQRIHAQKLIDSLSQGASLIIDEVDELIPNLKLLAVDVEQAVGLYTWINLYAGWRRQRAFDLHWDDHETIILQVSGRKQWSVYRPTRPYPVRKDPVATPTPTEPPVWEGLLSEGDLLYMPRGWWHVAVPVDEPSLHFTIAAGAPQGIDFLRWFVNRLVSSPQVRMDLPYLGSAAEQRQRMRDLLQAVTEGWDDNLLTEYLATVENQTPPRAQVTLPDGPSQRAGLQSTQLTGGTRLRLLSGRRLRIDPNGDGTRARFVAADRIWDCEAELTPALELLGNGHSPTLQSLCDRAPQASASLRLLVSSLVMAGVLQPEAERTPVSELRA